MEVATYKKVRAGYKATELGVIPEDWNVDIIDNHTHVTTGAKNTQDAVADGKYPFFVRSHTVERINSYSFDGEAVLTAGDGVHTGKIFHYINGKFDYHQRVYKLSDFSNDLDGHFFYHYFSNTFYARIMQMTAKSSVDSVRREMITKMAIALPPLPEQKAIATALSDIDCYIESLSRLIDKKKNIKTATMQQLLTGKKRLPGFSGEWNEITLRDLGFTYGGLTGKSASDFNSGSHSYITFMNVMTNPKINIHSFLKVKISPNERQNKVIKGDLLFNGSSETPEEVALCSALVDDIDNLYLNSFCFGFRFHDYKTVNPLFFALLFRSQVGRKLIFSLAQGATRYNISKTKFLKLQLLLPSLDEQNAIVSLLEDQRSEISTLEKKRKKYTQIKQGMMHELLTGNIRLV